MALITTTTSYISYLNLTSTLLPHRLTPLASSCLIFSSVELYIKMYCYKTHGLLLTLVSGLFFLTQGTLGVF